MKTSAQRLIYFFILALFASLACAQTPKAVWVWSHDKLEVRAFVEDLKEKDISIVYLDPGQFLSDLEARNRVRELTRELKKVNIDVEFLLGNPEWIRPEAQENALVRARKYLSFVRQFPPQDRPTAFHYDLEPQALPEWRTKRVFIVESYLKLIEKLTLLVHSSGLKMGIDVGFYFDSIEVVSKKRPLSELLLDLVDSYTIMAYRDQVDGENGILSLCKEEITYEEKKGFHKIFVGIETGESSEGDFLTFKDNGKEALNKALRELEESHLDGIAIHHYEAWNKLE